VTLRGIARRYAGALFDVVHRSGPVEHAEQAGRELAEFSRVVAEHDGLRKTFDTPAVPPQKKRAVLEALLAASPEMSGEVRRLLLLLAEQDRLMLLAEVAEAYAERLRASQRIVPAEIVTAVPLPEDRRAALAAALSQAAGMEVVMRERVDPALIGGVVARVGSTVYDGSVARQLERMKTARLTET
jgi:F-type H+-transporting ATPase subunit delta